MRHDGADIRVENVQVEVLTGRDLMQGFNGFLSTSNDANVFGEKLQIDSCLFMTSDNLLVYRNFSFPPEFYSSWCEKVNEKALKPKLKTLNGVFLVCIEKYLIFFLNMDSP